MNKIENKCKELHCKNYIEWDFGYGKCISCTLVGQSYHIEKIANDCPYKNEFKTKEYD